MAFSNLAERLIPGIIEESTKKAIFVTIKTEDEERAYIIPEEDLDTKMYQRIVQYASDGIFTQSLYDYITSECEKSRLRKDERRVIGPYILVGEYHFEA